MKAIVNGTERDVAPGTTISDLLREIDVPQQGVAVAKNDQVVFHARHGLEKIEEGDRVEIVRAVAGG